MLKRLTIYAFAALALGVVTNVCFNLYLNRDFRYFGKLIDTSTAWEEKLRKTHPQLYVIAGGSSSRTGINPQLLLDEFGIGLINAGLAAGYGLDANVALAHQHLRAHDTLILGIEPDLATGEDLEVMCPAGARMLLNEQGLSFYKNPMLDRSFSNFAQAFSSDSFALSSHIVKSITRPAGERYTYDKHTHIHESGWMEVRLREKHHHKFTLDSHAETLDAFSIDEKAKASYKRIMDYCAAHDIGVIALFPKRYAHDSYRAFSLWFMLQLTRMGFPVLYDAEAGITTDFTHLSDTVNHLNAEGTRLNTLSIGKSLRDQRFWTEEELVEQLRLRGWDDQGKRIRSATPPAQ